MSVLQDAIAKLKTEGFAVPPDISTIQQMPGLGPDEKIALLRASQNGVLSQMWGVGDSSAQSQIPAAARLASGIPASVAAQQIPVAAQQQRDTQVRDKSWEEAAAPPGGGPSRAAADYGSGDTVFKGPTQDDILAGLANNLTPDQKNPFRDMPAGPVAGVGAVPGVYGAIPNTLNQTTPGIPGTNPYGAQPAAVPDSTRASQIPTGGSLSGLPDWRINGYDPRKQKAGGGMPASTADEQIPDAANDPAGSGAPTMPSAPDVTALQMPDYSSLNMPGPIDFKFVNRDFSPQGRKLAADAFAPQYKAVDLAKRDTTDSYNTSDLVMRDMYAALAKSLTGDKTDDTERYAAQEAQQRTDNAAEQQRVADTYDSSNDILARTLNQVNGAQADNVQSPIAAKVLTEMAKERAAAQTTAGTTAERNLTSTKNRGTNQADYDTSIIEASRLQGASSREGLIRDLHKTLSGYDQQKLGYQSEERQAALQLADTLFGRDQDFQKTEYGQLSDQNQNAWNQYNAGVNQINGTNSVANQNISNQNAAAQSQYGTDTDNYWKQVQMDYQQTQDSITNAIAVQKANSDATGGAGSIDNLGPMGVIKQQIINDTPGASADAQNSAFQQAVSLYGNVNDYKDLNAFVYDVITKNPGLPQEVARAAAMAVWAGMQSINVNPVPKTAGG